MHKNFTATVMALGVVVSKCLFFLPQGFRINAASHIEVLENVILPQFRELGIGKSLVSQQDTTPSHKTLVNQDWL